MRNIVGKRSGRVMSYFVNSSWMLAEQFLKTISAIFVGIYVARYIGPEQFGLLSYALAIVSLFMVLSRLGMDSILIRDIASHTDIKERYLGTSFVLMLVASIVALFILVIMVGVTGQNTDSAIYVLIISVSLLFQPFFVVDYGFQALIQAKYSSIAKSIALTVSSFLKVYLVFDEAELVWFAVVYAADSLFIAIFLIIIFLIKKTRSFNFKFDKTLVRPMLESAWPLMLAAGAGILYMRVDQLMISYMLGAKQLGLYAAAAKLYEGWIIVPYVVSVSLLPVIVRLKASSEIRYESGLTKLFAMIFWPGILVALVTSVFSEWIIELLFGEAFLGAAKTLSIVMWTAAFSALGSLSIRYLMVEGMEKKVAVRTFSALLINIIMNAFLIPLYGIEGAAISTLICVFFSMYIIDMFDPHLKSLVKMKNRAITLRFNQAKVCNERS